MNKEQERLIRIMGTFDLATGHAETFDDLLDSLESELSDVLRHYREALAQALNSDGVERAPLYASPPKRPWQGLTNDEVNNFAAGCHLGKSVQGAIYEAEAKLKEKNV